MADLGVLCELCKARVDAATVADHFEQVHGFRRDDWKFETWPDGEVVIHDHTLTPGDFQ